MDYKIKSKRLDSCLQIIGKFAIEYTDHKPMIFGSKGKARKYVLSKLTTFPRDWKIIKESN